MFKKGGGSKHLCREVAEEEGVVIVEVVEDWKREKGGEVDGSWWLVGGAVDEDELTLVGAIEKERWIWEAIDIDDIINEWMDDWDDEGKIEGGAGNGEDTATGGGRGIWKLVLDGGEEKEKS